MVQQEETANTMVQQEKDDKQVQQQQEQEIIAVHNTTVLVIVVCEDDTGRLLMIQECKRKCRGKWSLPSGHVERNEDLSAAAKREAKEESGYDVLPLGIFYMHYVPTSSSNRVQLYVGIKAVIVGGELKTVEDAESIRAAWVTEEELLQKFKGGELRAKDTIQMCGYAKKNSLLPLV